MAKTWTIAEAYEAIKNNDKAAILDFGKRFPLATMAVSRMNGAEMLVAGLPDHVTMRKLDTALKDGVEPLEDEDKPKKETPVKKTTGKRGRHAKPKDEDEETEVENNPYEGKSAVELFKLCKKRGITVQPKQKSSVYIDLLLAADKKIEKQNDDADEDDDWEDDEEEEKPVKKSTKASKVAPTKKSAKKPEPEPEDDDEDGEDDDEDDSWDI